MTDKIKEKLLKGCGKEVLMLDWGYPPCEKGELCPFCKAKLQQHEETKKEILEKIENFKGQDYTDLEIWEDMKKELKKEIEK